MAKRGRKLQDTAPKKYVRFIQLDDNDEINGLIERKQLPLGLLSPACDSMAELEAINNWAAVASPGDILTVSGGVLVRCAQCSSQHTIKQRTTTVYEIERIQTDKQTPSDTEQTQHVAP